MTPSTFVSRPEACVCTIRSLIRRGARTRIDSESRSAARTRSPLFGRTRLRPGSLLPVLALLAIAAGAPIDPGASAATPGLVAAYSFDGGSGATVPDLSGSGNTGTLQGASWTTGGRFGGALAFNGTSSRVVIPDSASLDLSSAMTLEAWVYPTVVPSGWATVIYKESSIYYLDAGSSQNAPGGGGTFGSETQNVYGTSPLPANTWTHLAETFDGATLRLYVNGAEVANQSVTESLAGSTSPLSLGGNAAYGEYFNGRIDEVRIYNRALDPSEIQTDMYTSIESNPNGPRLIIAGPANGAPVVGTTVALTYQTSGDLPADVNHVHFQVDSQPVVMDMTLDGVYQLSGVHVGSHTLNGWLVRSDHSKISGTDAAPLQFTNVADPSDPTPPSVAISAPTDGATLTGSATVTAGAMDNVGVYGVQFQLDGVNLGVEKKTAPYSVTWDTAGVANGVHTLTAVARDQAGNETTSAAASVNVTNTLSSDPSVVGQWAGPFSWPLVSVHAALMPTGKVLLWDDHTDNAGVQIWDPIANTLTAKPYDTNNLFCSGHTLLPDGRVLVAGGHVSTYVGIPDATLFNPTTLGWSAAASMSAGRWYPTATSLPNGKVLAVSGATNCPTCGQPGGSHSGIDLIPEIYDPVANTWTRLNNASLSLPLYPHMHVLPDGRVLAVATQEDPIITRVLDLNTQTWSVVDPNVYDGGSSVMYRPGKILKTGSARNPDYTSANSAATAYVIDMNQPSPSWRQIASMAYPRTQHNLTVLPDGNVLVVGGGPDSNVFDTSLAILQAEMWSSTAETWTTMASMTEPRLYHSIAMLLPDARVLVSGGGRYGPDFPSAEIYSPPYLFKGARPTITSAPTVIQYGSHFQVGTPDGARIAKVTLLRLASVTHAFNANQKYVECTFSTVAGGLDVTAPSSANIAVPGHYMLFLVDTNGIPSVSSILRFPAPWEDTVPPTAPTSLAASGSPGKVVLTWTAATDNIGVTQYNIYRGTAPGVVPSPSTQVGQSPTTSYTDTGFAAGSYYYVVTAQDAGGNVGPKSNEVSVTVAADTTFPTVSITAPSANATVSGVVNVTASASDDVGVAGVQFLLDGGLLGSEVTTAPYTTPWNTSLSTNGAHTVSARARDAAGNTTTAASVPVTVSNSQVQGLMASYSFDDGTGTLVRDSSGDGNEGTRNGPSWTTGHFGGALLFNGTNSYVEAPNSSSLNISGNGLTIEMWANITAGSPTDYALLSKPWTTGSQGNPPYQYGVEYDSNGLHTLDFYFGDTTGTMRGPFSMTPNTGVWTHMAFTFNGTTVNAYLDGVQKLSAPSEASIQARNTTLRIGVDSLYQQGYGGKIDDLRIYNRALTQAQIQADMNSPVPPSIPPVPDGTFGTAMTARRGNAAGTTINLTWDVSGCPAKGYHTLYGPLSGVSTYQLSGGVCGMGTSGTFAWTSVPAGSLWFAIVGDDTNGTEGTWGTRTGGPMNGTNPSLVCGMTGRNNLGSCP